MKNHHDIFKLCHDDIDKAVDWYEKTHDPKYNSIRQSLSKRLTSDGFRSAFTDYINLDDRIEKLIKDGEYENFGIIAHLIKDRDDIVREVENGKYDPPFRLRERLTWCGIAVVMFIVGWWAGITGLDWWIVDAASQETVITSWGPGFDIPISLLFMPGCVLLIGAATFVSVAMVATAFSREKEE